MKRAAIIACAAALCASPLMAQSDAPARPVRTVSPVVHYGKWGAVLAFASLTALGALEHSQANEAYERLRGFCRDGGSCAIGPDGRYANPVAESRYQAVVTSDRAARTLLVSGQVALGGAAALFIVELLVDRGTKNIPLQRVLVAPQRDGATRVGITLPF